MSFIESNSLLLCVLLSLGNCDLLVVGCVFDGGLWDVSPITVSLIRLFSSNRRILVGLVSFVIWVGGSVFGLPDHDCFLAFSFSWLLGWSSWLFLVYWVVASGTGIGDDVQPYADKIEIKTMGIMISRAILSRSINDKREHISRRVNGALLIEE